jgi:alkanesulfonate monooxygenase SsuD/methylene tetrahydromethanopterin reductase-like flavin-dependent oxidoreductase (luciferase family)
MRFHWFAEATYPDLPPEFKTSGSSIWVDTPRRYADPAKQGEALNGFLELYEQADDLGFDGLAVNEHHQTAMAMTPSPNLLAAALCRTTKRAAILVIGDSLALYNPPIRVAEEMAMLDVMSGGRLIAGFVLGTPMDTTYCYGFTPSELRERFGEAHDLILKAWEHREPFVWNGKYTKLRYVNIWPEPIQRRPAIWVPGAGSRETMEFVVANDYCYGNLSFGGLFSARPVVQDFWEYTNKVGGNMNPHRLAFTQIVCVSETDARAEQEYGEAVKYFYQTGFSAVAPRFFGAPGYTTPRSTRYQMEIAQRRPKTEVREMTFKDYVEQGHIIAGSPATVRERLREMIQELRIGQLIATPHIGNLSIEQAKKNNYLFATEVMPYLRDLWSDYEDRWTPQGLREIAEKQAVAAAPAS